MKIISATCRKGDARNPDEYRAVVGVSSDGVEYMGTGNASTPDEALHKALSCACAEFTQRLHKSIAPEITVKF